MKRDEEIQDHIRGLLDEEFQRRLHVAEERLPTSCQHNYRQPLDTRKLVDGEENPLYNRIRLPVVQSIGLCMYGSEDPQNWPGTICEDPIDAVRCPPQAFTPRFTAEQIRMEFEAQIKNLEWVRSNLPEVHSLLWVLGDGETLALPEESEPEVLAPLIVREEAIPLSGWQRLLLFLCGLSRHRVLPPAP